MTPYLSSSLLINSEAQSGVLIAQMSPKRSKSSPPLFSLHCMSQSLLIKAGAPPSADVRLLVRYECRFSIEIISYKVSNALT